MEDQIKSLINNEVRSEWKRNTSNNCTEVVSLLVLTLAFILISVNTGHDISKANFDSGLQYVIINTSALYLVVYIIQFGVHWKPNILFKIRKWVYILSGCVIALALISILLSLILSRFAIVCGYYIDNSQIKSSIIISSLKDMNLDCNSLEQSNKIKDTLTKLSYKIIAENCPNCSNSQDLIVRTWGSLFTWQVISIIAGAVDGILWIYLLKQQLYQYDKAFSSVMVDVKNKIETHYNRLEQGQINQ